MNVDVRDGMTHAAHEDPLWPRTRCGLPFSWEDDPHRDMDPRLGSRYAARTEHEVDCMACVSRAQDDQTHTITLPGTIEYVATYIVIDDKEP